MRDDVVEGYADAWRAPRQGAEVVRRLVESCADSRLVRLAVL